MSKPGHMDKTEAHPPVHMTNAVAQEFPAHPWVERLVHAILQKGVSLVFSQVDEQWLYHPVERVLTVWRPDLYPADIPFLTVMLAHELGHITDFDRHPLYQRAITDVHWSKIPLSLEISAFVNGYHHLKTLKIKMPLRAYCAFIQEPLTDAVYKALAQ